MEIQRDGNLIGSRVHELHQELKERARSEINMMAVEGEIREAVEAIGRELVRELLMRRSLSC